MRPLYDARIKDLGPGDFVRVECICGHSELIPSSGLQQGVGLPPTCPSSTCNTGSAAANAIGAGGSWCRLSGRLSKRLREKFTPNRAYPTHEGAGASNGLALDLELQAECDAFLIRVASKNVRLAPLSVQPFPDG